MSEQQEAVDGLSFEEAMSRGGERRARVKGLDKETAKVRRTEQNKRANIARYRAFRALSLAHPAQYEAYYKQAKADVESESEPLPTTPADL